MSIPKSIEWIGGPDGFLRLLDQTDDCGIEPRVEVLLDARAALVGGAEDRGPQDLARLRHHLRRRRPGDRCHVGRFEAERLPDAGMQRDMRDALASRLYSGTSEMQRQIIAKWMGIA